MADKNVTSENKELAKYITAIVGINRTVQRYWDDNNSSFLDIFTCDDPTDLNVKFYGTIGLSDYPNEIEMKNKEQKNIPVEFLISGYKKFEKIPNILSTSGFYLSKDKWTCQPGSVFMRIVEMYYKNLEMKHVFFTSPFLWENKLESLKLETKTVNWLLGIPISDAELNYRNENGVDALERLFEEKGVDVFDLERISVV